MLNWRTITPSNSEKFLIKGTELSAALCGRWSRFQIVETRTWDRVELSGVTYVIRDAASVSDAEIRQGIRPRVVARFDDLNEAINYCMAFNSVDTTTDTV